MIIWTIEELYKWAKENKIENYTLFTSDEGTYGNCDTSEIDIDTDKETVIL